MIYENVKHQSEEDFAFLLKERGAGKCFTCGEKGTDHLVLLVWMFKDWMPDFLCPRSLNAYLTYEL